MYGAILGDMIGAPYEFDRGNKTKDFTLFTGGSNFTDDTVMTIAVAEALLNAEGKGEAEVKALIIESMQKWGRKYPNAGYGGRFIGWLWEADPKPYGSYGNGSEKSFSLLLRRTSSFLCFFASPAITSFAKRSNWCCMVIRLKEDSSKRVHLLPYPRKRCISPFAQYPP